RPRSSGWRRWWSSSLDYFTERPRKRVGDVGRERTGFTDLAREEGPNAAVRPHARGRRGQWGEPAGDQRGDRPAEHIARAADPERGVRLVVDVGLLSVGHHRDRALEDYDRPPLPRVPLREGHPRGSAGGDDAGLRFGKWKERDVRILAGDGLDDRACRGDRHDTRAAAEGGPRCEQGCPGIAQGTADDEHTAARLLPRILRQWFKRGADDASVERRRPRALG